MGLFDRFLRRDAAPAAPSEPPRTMPVIDAVADPNKLTQGARGFVNGLWQSTSALVNAFTGIGTSRDPSAYNEWALPRPLSRAEHVGMGRNGLIAQALGKLPYTATREGWRVVISDERVPADEREACADKIAAYESRLSIGTMTARALFRGRQHSHGLVLLGVADGRSFDQPVDWANVKTIRWAAVIDARDFQAYKMYSADSERFGEIEVYEIIDINGVLEDGLRYGPDAVTYQYSAVDADLRSQSGGTLKFHAERVLSFHTADYLSILDSLQDSLGGYFTSMSGVSTAARESSMVVYAIDQWLQKAWSEDANLAHAHMTFVDKAKSVLKAWVIDKDHESVTVSNRNLGGVADLPNPFMVQVSAALGIPVTEFWGVSPGGFGKGESEKLSFHQDVRAFQRVGMTPQLMHLHALILVAQDGCNLPRDIQRTLTYEDLTPPDEEIRSKLRNEASMEIRQLVKDRLITRAEARPAIVALQDDYFRPEIDLEREEDKELAPVGVFTGGTALLQAVYPEGIPIDAARNFMLALASTYFGPENITGVFPERTTANPAQPIGTPTGAAPGDIEDDQANAEALSPDEPNEVDVAWSQNPLPSDAMEAAAIAAELSIPTVRVTRAHRAGLIEGWTILGGKPRYSLTEVKRVVLQGNGKLPPAEASTEGAALDVRDSRRAPDLVSIIIVARVPDHIAQWVPYKAEDRSAPHVTLLYVGKVAPSQVLAVIDAARRVLAETEVDEIDFNIEGVDYFDNDDGQRIAHLRITPTHELTDLHARLRAEIERVGVKSAHIVRDYRPHVTLAYLPAGAVYDGPVTPYEGWSVCDLEVWCDDFALTLPLEGECEDAADGDAPIAVQDKGPLTTQGWIWRTQRDTRVRPEHKRLNGTRFPIGGRHETQGEPGEAPNCRCAKEIIVPPNGTKRARVAAKRAVNNALARRYKQVTVAAEKRQAAKAAEAGRDELLDETTVKRWLVEHISGLRKMPRDRMAKLKACEATYPYLAPPDVTTVYRGLYNVKRSAAGKLVGLSDAVFDKSWTTDIAVAARFAAAEYTDADVAVEYVGVVLIADASTEHLLLNAALLAELPGVGDYYHERWGETLHDAILAEKEVLALAPLYVRTAKVVEMSKLATAGEEYMIRDAQDTEMQSLQGHWSRAGFQESANVLDLSLCCGTQALQRQTDGNVEEFAVVTVDICDDFDETAWLAECEDLSEEAKEKRIAEAYRKYHEVVNMGAAELREWAKTKRSKLASVSRAPIDRNLTLLETPREKWTLAHAASANRTVNFVSRMRGAEQGKPTKIDGREGPSKRDISLKNWAFDPAK